MDHESGRKKGGSAPASMRCSRRPKTETPTSCRPLFVGLCAKGTNESVGRLDVWEDPDHLPASDLLNEAFEHVGGVEPTSVFSRQRQDSCRIEEAFVENFQEQPELPHSQYQGFLALLIAPKESRLERSAPVLEHSSSSLPTRVVS